MFSCEWCVVSRRLKCKTMDIIQLQEMLFFCFRGEGMDKGKGSGRREEETLESLSHQ